MTSRSVSFRDPDALGLLLALLHLSTSLRLGAFNIDTFGITKASNDDQMNYICRIVCRYDIILIQEVRDPDESVIERLKKAVNNCPACPGSSYNCIYSEPLGPNNHKERYVFLYRVGMVSMVGSYTYDDPHCFYDVFSRPPFIVEFSSEHTVVEKFVLIAQHTTPRKAVKQIDALYDVVTDVKNRWNNNNIVLLGDFNAGGEYVSGTKWEKIRLSKRNGFNWLITDDHKTTVITGLPYDRIVVTDDMMKGVKPRSAEVYNFMSAFGLTEQQILICLLSNHYPVEVTLIEKDRTAKTVAKTSTVNCDNEDLVGVQHAATMTRWIN